MSEQSNMPDQPTTSEQPTKTKQHPDEATHLKKIVSMQESTIAMQRLAISRQDRVIRDQLRKRNDQRRVIAAHGINDEGATRMRPRGVQKMRARAGEGMDGNANAQG